MKSVALHPSLLWHALAQRFNALARRERLLVLVAAAAAAFMAADQLWLDPALKSWSQARQRSQVLPALAARQAADTRQAEQMQAMKLQHVQAEMTRLRTRLRDGESALRHLQAGLVGPAEMVGLLEQVLARRGAVRVREMTVLPRTELSRPGQAASAGQPAVYRHGIEITLEGNWNDLLAYLDALESLDKHPLWGALHLRVEQYPKALMTLRLHTLSLDGHWLEI